MTRVYTASSLKHSIIKGKEKRVDQIFLQSRWVTHKVLHIGYDTPKNTLWGVYHIESFAIKEHIFILLCTEQKYFKNECFFCLAIYLWIFYTQLFDSFFKGYLFGFLIALWLMKNLSFDSNIILERRWIFRKLVRGLCPNACRVGI